MFWLFLINPNFIVSSESRVYSKSYCIYKWLHLKFVVALWVLHDNRLAKWGAARVYSIHRNTQKKNSYLSMNIISETWINVLSCYGNHEIAVNLKTANTINTIKRNVKTQKEARAYWKYVILQTHRLLDMQHQTYKVQNYIVRSKLKNINQWRDQ